MPTMFASILFSQILIKLEFDKYLPGSIKKIFRKLFNLNDNEVVIFLLSMISGYPNNARMLSKNENLNNIINYTNFISPIFLICTVGGIYLKNIGLSLLILFSHYLSNFVIAILLKNKNKKVDNNINNQKDLSFLQIYYSSLKNTITTLSIIFANILFFSIINSLITSTISLNEPLNSLILGILEFSNGIYSISITNLSIFIKGLLILIIISFSSFSIHMQMLSINNKIKYTKFLLFRLLSIFISIIIYLILFFIIY